MALFSYADETKFDIDKTKGHTSLGCAIFITDTEITQELIDEALLKLRNVKPANDSIRQSINSTLRRGMFHASKDSNYAKDCLLEVINKSLNGVLCTTYYKNPEQIDRPTDLEKFFERCMTTSSIEFFNAMDEINLVIEQRPTLASVHIERWKETIYRLFENSSFKLPSFKTYFPQINISLGDKSVPGLQVVDLLLWIINQSKKTPLNDDWKKKLRFGFYRESRQEGSKQSEGQYFLNKAMPRDLDNYPVPYENSETHEDLIWAWLRIEQFLRLIEESDFDETNRHLYNNFIPARTLLLRPGYNLKENDLSLIGRTFIRLFDSMPLYKYIPDSDIEAWKAMHHAKHIASIILASGHLHVGRTKDFIIRWRFQNEERLDDIIASMG